LDQDDWRRDSIFSHRVLKQTILGAFKREIGQGSRQLGDFWKVYRNVMKRIDFDALKEIFDFGEFTTTRCLCECLQEQVEGILYMMKIFTLYEMMYP